MVVVNWNGWRHTLACLDSLRASVDAGWRLFLVDNASSDESTERLGDLGDDVVLVRSPVNGGWTGGNNLGVRHALEAGHELIFILNNDAIVLPETIGLLRRAQQNDPATLPLLGPAHLKPSGDAYDFIGAEIDPYSGMPRLVPGAAVAPGDLPASWETTYIKGAGLFAHRRHFETIGWFDDAFYLTYDETDWCFRARALGFKSLMLRDAVIRHAGSASIGGAASPLNLYFLVRNGLLFAERHCTPRQRLRLARVYSGWARSFVPGARDGVWAWSFLTSRARHARVFRAAVRDYVLRRFGDCPAWIRSLDPAPPAPA